MKSKVTAHIKGINSYTGKPFETSVMFELFPPTSESHYGTGYYMGVSFPNGYDESVDVRYEGTTDLIALVTKYISNKWTNLTELTIG